MAYDKPTLIDDNSIDPAGVGAIAPNVYWLANVMFTVNAGVTANVIAEYNVAAEYNVSIVTK